MIALSSAVEPLRMANILTGESVYEWSIASLDGTPTSASNGLQMSPTIPVDGIGAVDILFVCAGVDVQSASRRKSSQRYAGSRATGTSRCAVYRGYALAKAGLLDKYKASIHWENLSALREEFRGSC